jgi:hypothetical protein
MPLDAAQVLAPEQAVKLRPGDRVILADRRPSAAVFIDEIRRVGRNADPRQAGGALRHRQSVFVVLEQHTGPFKPAAFERVAKAVAEFGKPTVLA